MRHAHSGLSSALLADTGSLTTEMNTTNPRLLYSRWLRQLRTIMIRLNIVVDLDFMFC